MDPSDQTSTNTENVVTQTTPNTNLTGPQLPANGEQPTVTPPSPGIKKPLDKKKLGLIGIVAAALLVTAGAGAYFGIILPNKPENVWGRALINTGKGYDKLVNYADENKDTKGATFKGNFKFEGGDFVTDGSIEGHSFDNNSTFKADAGIGTGRINLEAITIKAENSKNPDVYVKVKGIKGLGSAYAGEFGAQFDSLEDQWLSLDHTVLDNLEKQAVSNEGEASSDIKAEDVVSLARKIGEVNKEYVFTSDQSKAVVVVAENVGKEKLDNRSVYHYKVKLHKENLKAYNKAMCDKIVDDKVYKLMAFGSSQEDLKKECYDTKDIDSINESETADAWVDMKTKLIRKVRITEKDKKDNYFDVGLNYNGGDEYPFTFSYHSKDGDTTSSYTFGLSLNTKSDTANINFDMVSNGGGETMKGTFKLAVTPSDKPVDVKKPEGAKPLNELMGSLLGGFGGLSGSQDSSGADSETTARCARIFEQMSNSNGVGDIPAECEALFNTDSGDFDF